VISWGTKEIKKLIEVTLDMRLQRVINEALVLTKMMIMMRRVVWVATINIMVFHFKNL
jgi:hypothetical protein